MVGYRVVVAVLLGAGERYVRGDSGRASWKMINYREHEEDEGTEQEVAQVGGSDEEAGQRLSGGDLEGAEHVREDVMAPESIACEAAGKGDVEEGNGAIDVGYEAGRQNQENDAGGESQENEVDLIVVDGKSGDQDGDGDGEEVMSEGGAAKTQTPTSQEPTVEDFTEKDDPVQESDTAAADESRGAGVDEVKE